MAVALVMVVAVALSACGSSTTSDTSSDRNAGLFAKAIELCVVGGYGTSMTWEFRSISAGQAGPFALPDKQCIRTSATWRGIVYNADGSRLLLLDGINPDMGYPAVTVGCWINDDADFTSHSFSEGEYWGTTCSGWRVDVNRFSDTADLKRFDVHITS